MHADCLPLPDLVESSFEEAQFLWRRWEAELTSLTRNLTEVWSWTEDRLHGALDGVRVSPEQLIELCTPTLTSDDLRDVTASAALLASCDHESAHTQLIDRWLQSNGPIANAITRGVNVAAAPAMLARAAQRLDVHQPNHAATLCNMKAFRAVTPDREMITAFESGVPELQIAALQAARYVSDQSLEQWVAAGLRVDHADVQLAAIETGLCRGSRTAWEAAVARASTLTAGAAPYLSYIARLGTPEQHELVYSALRIPELQPAALWALGHIGTLRAAQTCIHGMKHDAIARRAGEAYCHITGANLERDNLARSEPAVDVPSFEDDDLDADLVPTADALWPLPDADRVQAHFDAFAAAAQPDARCVQGRPLNINALLMAIEDGPMLRRTDVARELSMRTRGRYDVQTTAFAATQKQMMAHSRAALAG